MNKKPLVKKPVVRKKVVKAEVSEPITEASEIKVITTPVYKFSYNQIPNHNFSFALLNNDNVYLHTPFYCKDYIQDIFWSEYTKKEGTQYGLTWKPEMLNIDTDYFSLCIDGGKETMRDRIPFMKELISYFDLAQGFKPTEVMETNNNNRIIVRFSKEWTSSGPLISALTTLIRISGVYEGGKPDKYLGDLTDKTIQKFPSYMNVEVGRLSSTYTKLLYLLGGGRIEYSWDKLSNMGLAHACGIVNWRGMKNEYEVKDED